MAQAFSRWEFVSGFSGNGGKSAVWGVVYYGVDMLEDLRGRNVAVMLQQLPSLRVGSVSLR